MSFEDKVPYEKYELLSKKVSSSYKNEDGKTLPAAMIKEVLERAVDEHLDSYIEKNNISLTKEQRDKQYKINDKDPYQLLSPKREGKNRSISQKKFWFFWDFFEMDSFVEISLNQNPKNYLFDALKNYIYTPKKKTSEKIEVNGDLVEGNYVLKRMSLNANFKGFIAVIRIWVYSDTNQLGEKVLKYKALNFYNQDSSESDKPYERARVSEGYVLRNQYNTLLFGSIDYSHLDETEGKASPNHYPEIISLHTASPFSRLFVGFVLANYPDYRKPSVTQCCIERIEDYPYTFDQYMKKLEACNSETERKEGLDSVIGVRPPTEKELSYLTFVMNESAHKNILVAQNAEAPFPR